jgi:NAD(P)-dependent dehydrogenase (short-subunit alcohol dehydrogenase family)
MGLDGRVALVTGGGRGIGAAICVALAEDGADVAVNYRRSADEAAEVVAAVEALGRRAIAVPAAVEDNDACAVMVDRVTEELGGLSILVHNAGIASRGRSVADTDAAEPGRLIANHALGPFALTQFALPHLRAAGADGGRADVVFISSVATAHMAAFGAPYNMGKAAMEALAFTLAKEERKKGVHVNVVAPGLVRTEMGRRLVKAWGTDIDDLDAGSPFGRVCTPEDVAAVVRWVVSDGAGYVTGARIQVDGGGTG